MAKQAALIDCDVPSIVPVLFLKSRVLFPLQVVSVEIALKQNLRLLEKHPGSEVIVGAGVFVDPDGPFTRNNVSSAAVACRVLSRIRMDHGTIRIVLQGLRRIRLTRIITSRPFFKARVECLRESERAGPKARNLIKRIMHLLEDLVKLDGRLSEELLKIVKLNRENGSRCADLVADMIPFSYADKRRLLETGDVSARLALLAELIARELARARLAGEVLEKTEASIERTQREAFLREQLGIIRHELEALDPSEVEITRLEKKADAGNLPPEVAEELRREVQRLHDSEVRMREGSSIRAYIDWTLSMPWDRKARDRSDLRRARRILESRYFGLGSAQDLLLEYLAVRKLRGSNLRPLLGIMGPPGTGRTSLASTVARILGRPFVRIPMHGVHDEAEIRGSSRTDAVARPGRILDGLREAGVSNPVILIDEIDRLKPGAGDPMLALLEALDPERNSRFHDYYLNAPFDLSEVLFIITGKVAEEMPDALGDLVYIIELSGYTEQTKLAIAKEYIWPEIVEDHGLTPHNVRLTSAALRKIIRSYTREAGIHDLKFQLRRICRRMALQVATGGRRRISVDGRNLEKYLGKPVYTRDRAGRRPKIGAVTGLAWTEEGGDLLPIEALLMPGAGTTTLTGLLGEVLEESVEAALSYVRSRARQLKIPQNIFDEKDLHVHFPEGAIPKDGPSAGIAAATTIASLLSKRPVRNDLAMTGEISLQGRVLPVGGVREKMLAAYRAGIKHVILPKGNESDLIEVPPEVRSKMKFHLVSEVSEVFKLALMKKRKARRQ